MGRILIFAGITEGRQLAQWLLDQGAQVAASVATAYGESLLPAGVEAFAHPMAAEEMAAFLKVCLERAGADTMITPREIIRDYITVLNILLQNPDTTFSDVVGSGVVKLEHESETAVAEASEAAIGTNSEASESAVGGKSEAGDFDLEDIEL